MSVYKHSWITSKQTHVLLLHIITSAVVALHAETAAIIHDPPAAGELRPRPKDRNVAWPLGTTSAHWRRPAAPAAPGTPALIRHRRTAPPESGGTQVPPRRQGLQVVGAESVIRACAVSPRPDTREGPELLLRGGHRRLPRVHQEQVVLPSCE